MSLTTEAARRVRHRVLRREEARRPHWKRAAVWASVLLHLALMLALLRWTEPRDMAPAGPEAEVPVVFETVPGERAQDQPEQAAAETPPAEAPTPTEAPDASAAEVPPPAATAPPPQGVPEAPPQPAEAVPPEPAPPVTEAQPEAVPQAAPPPVEAVPAPTPEAALPPPAPEPDSTLDTTIALARPTPLQLNPPPPLPQQRQPAPPRRGSPFAGTTDLSQGPPISLAPQPPGQRRAPPPGRGLDMAMGPVPQRSLGPRRTARGANALDYVSGVRPDQDWISILSAWAQARGYYPRQAAQAGEDGVVVLQVTIQRSGRVSAVRVTSTSGSRWLDSAALAVFRDQMAPAFTPDMADAGESTTLTFRAYYNLIYQ